MTEQIEAALKVWLESKGHATCFSAGETLPTDEQHVLIYVPEATRAAGSLYRATCTISVVTPPHHSDSGPTVSRTAHGTKERSLRALLESPETAALAASLESVGGLFYRGIYLRDGGSASIEDGKWVTVFDFVIGIATVEVDP
jgi:hypothetical protein